MGSSTITETSKIVAEFIVHFFDGNDLLQQLLHLEWLSPRFVPGVILTDGSTVITTGESYRT
jgi:hypothetical protein